MINDVKCVISFGTLVLERNLGGDGRDNDGDRGISSQY